MHHNELSIISYTQKKPGKICRVNVCTQWACRSKMFELEDIKVVDYTWNVGQIHSLILVCMSGMEGKYKTSDWSTS